MQNTRLKALVRTFLVTALAGAFGSARAQQTLVITSQPQSQTVALGDRVEFSVGVEGGPVSYRWQKDGEALTSTSNRVVISSALPANAGDYRVIVANTLDSATSSVARLTVTPATAAPQVVRAVIDDDFGSNNVHVVFNEVMNSASARNLSHYRLVPNANTNVSIQIASILYSAALGVLIQIDPTDSNWDKDGDYFLVLNNIADSQGNNIAPYTRVPVSKPIVVNLAKMGDTWNYYDVNFVDPNGFDIYTNSVNPWYGVNYAINQYWATGEGIFHSDLNSQGLSCAGYGYGRQISFQAEPTLFRRTFDVSNLYSTNGSLRLRFAVDDGMIVYLNGVEIHRYNMPASNVILTHLTKAILPINAVQCVTNVVVPLTQLKAGTNTLAAVVYQFADSQNDTLFGLEMDAVFLQTPEMPIKEPGPHLLILTKNYTRANRTMALSWPTNFSGYSLYAKSDLNPTSPWVQVRDQSNPYSNTVPANGFRFYGLGKP